MRISEDTRDVIRQFLRGYKKGYGFDLNDYVVSIEMSESTLGVILADLCELANENFYTASIMDGPIVREAGKQRIEQWRASDK